MLWYQGVKLVTGSPIWDRISIQKAVCCQALAWTIYHLTVEHCFTFPPTFSMSSVDDDHNIPSITVITTDFASSNPQLVRPSRSPTSGGLLSPTSLSNHHHNVPPSPSDISDSSSVPPSPTLSAHSANYPTTLKLRENQPEGKDGLSSLGLLDPASAHIATHHRKGSTATSMTDVDGESSRSVFHQVPSAATSATHVDFSTSVSEKKPSDADGKKKKKTKKGEKSPEEVEEESRTAHQRELAQDEAINPAPFRFKPFQLAHMLDPKSLDTLAAFGGTEGLIRGLGTHSERGLSTKGDASNDKGAGEGSSHRHESEKKSEDMNEKVPDIVLTEPNGQQAAPSVADDGKTVSATMEDRRRVYGANTLPTRVSKTLLQLMITAFKDRVLVRSFRRSYIARTDSRH